ncbi:MAG TPA: GerW family sporulation protein, partial [Firmicutes bacterium]|nr:GerW family sporulation protein [Bacillota bacterium]
GGGSGAGINITPIALIVINQNGVQALPLVSKPETSDKMVNLVPEMFDKLTSLFSKKKETTETVEVKAGAENGESSVTVTETEASGGKE